MTHPETKEFPVAAIASIATGTLLCDFSSMHEAAEWLMGHPIWTHHFADRQLADDMQRTILAQIPNMPTKLTGVTRENYREHLATIETLIGKTVKILKGSGLTALLPSDGIPSGACVIGVDLGK